MFSFKNSFEDVNLIDDKLVDFLTQSDYVVPNVEGALTNGTKLRGDKSVPAHASDPRAVYQLLKIKGNLWNLSNNHILDCGIEGFKNTSEIAENNNCEVFGAGVNITEAAAPYVINKANGIGIVAVCYKDLFRAGHNKPGIVFWNDFNRIKAMVREVKKTCRWCVLIAHGGEEFSSLPLSFVRKKYHKYLKFGADIIVGHHPHVPQNYERVGRKTIFYSLGNFIFDTDYQRIQENTDRGILLKIIFEEEKYTFEHISYKIDRDSKRIIKWETPDIFRDISKSEYKKLIPFATKKFLEDYKRAKIFLKPHMADYNIFDWVNWYVKNKGLIPCISILWQLVRYKLKKYKKNERGE